MRLLIIILSIIMPVSCAFAQFTDDFSDGNFTNNPIWDGDVTSFEINNSEQLHLKTINADTAILYTSSTVITNSEWRFFIKQSFNSSNNNHTRVYLASNNSDLKSNLNGYYIQIGSTNDNICLWRQDGDIHTKLIDGTNMSTGGSVNKIFIKAICDPTGKWEIFAHDDNSSMYISEGIATDITYSSCSYFGIFCKFTMSNSTKFYFDDFYVGSIIVDTLAPKVESILVNSPLTIDVKFDEVVEKNSAENESNYVIDNGIGNVSQVIRSNTDSSIVHITLTTALSYEQLYKLTISGIKDGANNIMQSANFDIIWYNIIKGDVVINEIMCDPSPVVALHDAEWVELYNNSPKQLDLSNWTLQIGSSAKTINYGRIDAHSYIIIGHQDDEYLLAQYGSFIGLSSFSLANSSGKILLKNDLGEIMHYVNYSQNWYKDAAKSDGGWTLEMIDSHNSCGEIDNWAASENLDGGTPAYQNSIKAKNQDKKAPLVERIIVSSNNSLEIYFSESTDSVSVMDITKYKVSEGIGSPFIVQASYPDYKSYTLQFNGNFINEVLYNLEIENGISDCAGNSISEKSILRFGIPQKIDSSDIIINEVLFHPKNNGVDYVEIYNNSDKIIDLKELQLSSWNTEDENWYNINDISKNGFQIFPYEYYVLTTNKDVVMQQYFVAEPNNIIEMESLPSMSNTEGNIFITNKSLQMIDGMEYSDEMHYALLDNPEGISLERLSVSTSALDRSNWHSAATPGRNAEGFGGTPTYENSQSAASISQGEWSRAPEIFSPDNDGLDDYLQINYNMKEPGYTANVSIYDSKGRLIRKLSSGQILGAQGQIIWDGLNDNRQKSKIGIYVILIDYFNLKGDAQATKLTCVLGGDL